MKLATNNCNIFQHMLISLQQQIFSKIPATTHNGGSSMPWFEVILLIILTAGVVVSIVALRRTHTMLEALQVRNARLERELFLLENDAHATARLNKWNETHPEAGFASPEGQSIINDCRGTYRELIAEHPYHTNPMWEWTLNYCQSH